jgi:hypothetical protein
MLIRVIVPVNLRINAKLLMNTVVLRPDRIVENCGKVVACLGKTESFLTACCVENYVLVRSGTSSIENTLGRIQDSFR